MRKLNRKWAIFTVTSLGAIFCATLGGAASNSVGTLTAVEGEVILLSRPSKKFSNTTPPPVMYEGEYFQSQLAQVGMHVEKGNVLRTTLQGRARVIYENGDQFNVAPGTAYRIDWQEKLDAKSNAKSKNFETRMELLHGKIRGIIDKAGPRNQLRIRTRAAVIGIRGTDFTINCEGAENKTEVSILRGAVEVRSVAQTQSAPKGAATATKTPDKAQPKTEVRIIRAGEIGIVTASTPVIAPKVEIRRTTQEELISSQRIAEIETKSSDIATTKAVSELEQKAKEVTLRDIKTHDPKLFAQIQANPQKATSLNEINAVSVTQAYKTAPKAPPFAPTTPQGKPQGSELDRGDQDIYKKYFKDLK